MDCRDIERLLPDHFAGSLAADERRAVDEHLLACAACAEEVELWNALGNVPAEQPSPMLRRNFDLMLSAYQHGREQDRTPSVSPLSGSMGSWFRHAFVPAAAALAVIVIAFLAGIYVERRGTDSSDIAHLREELANTRQLVALSMLQQQSASDRLQGVSWTRRVDGNPEIMTALLHTLRSDNSVDVRLAALDALRQYADQPNVRTGIEDSFRHQKSPLVQIAVVDLMVEIRDRAAVDRLRNFASTPNLDPAVKERIEWGVRQLNRG